MRTLDLVYLFAIYVCLHLHHLIMLFQEASITFWSINEMSIIWTWWVWWCC